MLKKHHEVEEEELYTFMNILSSNEDKKVTIVEFHSPTIAVREDIGQFPVTVWRHGNLNTRATIRYNCVPTI